jgi:NADH-ubiquinone oxidoreductase chain 1
MLQSFFLIVFVKFGVAFLTLLKRRILGHIHIRKGPKKVGFVGIFQLPRDPDVFLRTVFSFGL